MPDSQLVDETGTVAPAGTDPAGLPKDRRNWIAAVLAVVLLVVIVGVWQLAVTQEWTSSLVLPPPADVFASLKNGFATAQGSWWPDIWVTLSETVIGFAIGVVAAMVVGAVFAYVDVLRKAVYPYVLFMQTFPKIAVAPLLVAWLGYGAAPKIVISALLAFFPVFTNTITGLSRINGNERRLIRSCGANWLQELWYLRLPNAKPYIFAAMDVALVVALLGTIVGEFVGSKSGLGYRIQQSTAFGDTASVYAVLIILGALGIALHFVMVALKSWLVFEED
ncbi:MAG TPA: ABC transporter permease [Streptosporangiaceae bacterium]|jgi:NitT/TauT family transport system permease protein